MGGMDKELTDTLWDAICNLQYEGISFIDKSGNYYALNNIHETMFGYGDRELNGKPWEILYPKDQADIIKNEYLPVLKKTGSWKGNLVGARKDGSKIHIHASFTLIKSGILEGGIFCLCYDKTTVVQKRSMLVSQLKELLGR